MGLASPPVLLTGRALTGARGRGAGARRADAGGRGGEGGGGAAQGARAQGGAAPAAAPASRARPALSARGSRGRGTPCQGWQGGAHRCGLLCTCCQAGALLQRWSCQGQGHCNVRVRWSQYSGTGLGYPALVAPRSTGDTARAALGTPLARALLRHRPQTRRPLATTGRRRRPPASGRSTRGRGAQDMAFKSALARGVYTALFEPERINAAELFQPGRTAFVYELDGGGGGGGGSPDIPTTLRRSRADCPPVRIAPVECGMCSTHTHTCFELHHLLTPGCLSAGARTLCSAVGVAAPSAARRRAGMFGTCPA